MNDELFYFLTSKQELDHDQEISFCYRRSCAGFGATRTFTGMENMPQLIWLALNTVEVVLLLTAWRLLHELHPCAGSVVGIIGVILLVAVVLENFIIPLGDGFWVSNSTLLILGLVLAAIYLVNSDSRSR